MNVLYIAEENTEKIGYQQNTQKHKEQKAQSKGLH